MSMPPGRWRAAVCYDSPSVTRIVRETLDEMEWSYERDRALHHFSKLMVVIAIPSNSYVFRFKVNEPIQLKIDVYDERPTHAGDIHFLELDGITPSNAPKVRRFLQRFSEKLPRKPYSFFMVERFKAGFLNRHHMISRREWSRWGV
jgi:hypothetical protein